MSNPLENLRAKINSRTRDEWRSFILEKWTDLRIWVQENGESAFLVAMFLGMFLVIAFKFFVALILALCAVAALVWYLAPTSNSYEGKGGNSNGRPDAGNH